MKPFRHHTLAREIAIILLIKLVLLSGLWYAFFRDTPQRHVDSPAVSERILGGSAPQPSLAKEHTE